MMTNSRLHTMSPVLRIGVIALWMFSLVSVGVSPLYYITTSTSSAEGTDTSQVIADINGANPQASQSENRDQTSALTVRLTLNPFVSKKNAAKSTAVSASELEGDGGMNRSAPHNSPVVLWLVNASTSGTVSSSHWHRVYHLEGSTETLQNNPKTALTPASALQAEHPGQRSVATLLGQKPSGVS